MIDLCPYYHRVIEVVKPKGCVYCPNCDKYYYELQCKKMKGK